MWASSQSHRRLCLACSAPPQLRHAVREPATLARQAAGHGCHPDFAESSGPARRRHLPPPTLSHQSRSMTTPLAARLLMPRGTIFSGMAAWPLASSSFEAAGAGGVQEAGRSWKAQLQTQGLLVTQQVTSLCYKHPRGLPCPLAKRPCPKGPCPPCPTPPTCDPHLCRGGHRLPRLVQHLARILIRLQPRQRQPQLHMLRAALHRARLRRQGCHNGRVGGGPAAAGAAPRTPNPLLEAAARLATGCKRAYTAGEDRARRCRGQPIRTSPGGSAGPRPHQQHAGVVLLADLHHSLPQPHRLRDALQGSAARQCGRAGRAQAISARGGASAGGRRRRHWLIAGRRQP